MVTASICAGCGETPLSVLHWTETGETVEAFRKRMWKKTPMAVALVHYLVPPLLGGLIAIACIPTDVIDPRKSIGLYAICFGVASLVMLIVFTVTPIAGLVPAAFGIKYHKYR
jgi:hypothetical protein